MDSADEGEYRGFSCHPTSKMIGGCYWSSFGLLCLDGLWHIVNALKEVVFTPKMFPFWESFVDSQHTLVVVARTGNRSSGSRLHSSVSWIIANMEMVLLVLFLGAKLGVCQGRSTVDRAIAPKDPALRHEP